MRNVAPMKIAKIGYLAVSAALCGFGIQLLLIRTQEVLASFATVLGILILMDGLLKIQIAVEARPFGIRLWWLILASAIVTGVFGVLLIFRPSESQDMMMRFMGVALILDAELNASTVLTSVKIVRNQRAEA